MGKYQEGNKTAKKAVVLAEAAHYGDVNELESRDGERYLPRIATERLRESKCFSASMTRTANLLRTSRRH